MPITRSSAPAFAPPGDTSSAALKLLVTTGLQLARERDVEVIVQSALDAGKELCGAEYGAFFYSVHNVGGKRSHTQKLTGSYAAKPEEFPLSATDEGLMEHFFGSGIIRCADISVDAHFGAGTPFAPLTRGPNPVKSYMVVPVHSAAGELFGGLFYGHSQGNRFLPHTEAMLESIAAQAAISIDNAMLHERLNRDASASVVADHHQQETDRRLRQALDAAQLGTWCWDRHTDMLDLDERAALLFRAEAGTPISRSALRERIVIEDDRASTIDRLQAAVDAGSLYQAEYRIVSPEPGEPIWLCAYGMPTFGDHHEVIGMTGTVQDISPRKNQEHALRQSEKLAATGRLAATIAHEINNPLEAVTNLIYLVKTDPTIPPTAQHLLETADQELARVAAIAQQTLGFYRDTTRPVDIDLTDLLKGVVELFRRKLTYKKIECVLDLAPNLHVFALQGELRQVFSNLVVNAIDASLHGRIVIRAKQCLSHGVPGVSVLICDQGTGIPAAVRERLFAPFFTTKQSVGTGLGLWVTRGIIEKQGGTVRFRSSTQPPSGTTFRVFLPAIAQILKTDAPLSSFIQ